MTCKIFALSSVCRKEAKSLKSLSNKECRVIDINVYKKETKLKTANSLDSDAA